MTSSLRVALFTDCYEETNGVATLAREYAAYARDLQLPFLLVRAGSPKTTFHQSGNWHELELHRGPLAFPIDAGLYCDPFLCRHRSLTIDTLQQFRPDLIHVTGPGDVSTLGMWAANLVGVPTVASWHTNLHEYAYRRMQGTLRHLPCALREVISKSAGQGTLRAVSSYYRINHFLAAPNQEAVDLLIAKTGRPSYLMAHGVNTRLFDPRHRTSTDPRFTIGYVGRLTKEKSVRALVGIEQSLLAAGETNFRLLIVGDGCESEYLRQNLRHAEFTGILRGDALATAYANMDAFVFPSLTDTFGLVILEAMSSGVPVVLHVETGHRAGVIDQIDGFLASDFAPAISRLIHCPETLAHMRTKAREHACQRSWSDVFDDLYRIYGDGLAAPETIRRMPTRKFASAPFA